MRVLVFGTFDHLHPGHEFVLKEASKRGDLFVVVARDETVQRIKKHSPRQSHEERAAAIRESFPHAQVIIGDANNYLVPVESVKPDLILLGYDQQLPPGVGQEDLPCPTERLAAFQPEKHKSSKRKE